MCKAKNNMREIFADMEHQWKQVKHKQALNSQNYKFHIQKGRAIGSNQ